MNQDKLDRQLARLIKKHTDKYYFTETDLIQAFLKVTNFALGDQGALVVCFTMTKVLTTDGYLLQYTNVTENEIKELTEITKEEFNNALEQMKVWVDLGTLYDT